MWRVWAVSLLAAVPSSTNYTLQSFDFGNGANDGSSSSYHLRGTAGSSGGVLSSATYTLPPGIQASATVPTPPAPTFTNPDSSYHRLRLTINPGTQPADTKYAIAISDNGFATTQYVQPDQTIGGTFTAANYQTYAAWGAAGGAWITGLASNTVYTVKVAALHGAGTGSGFGPTANAATVLPTATFSLATSLTSTPPFTAAFGTLSPGTVTAANATVTATLTSNAAQGGQILIKNQNGGLFSSTAGYTLPSATANLDATLKGYGAQITATSQVSGGPMVALAPYNNTVNNVGGLGTAWLPLASFSAPVTDGSTSFRLAAKADIEVPPAANYSDALNIIISLVF